MKSIPVALAATVIFACAAAHAADPKVVHAFVALCDNEHQGIVPVPKAIGNGDDPNSNLYWGAGEGLRSVFRASKSWTKIENATPPGEHILERLVMEHQSGAILIADAYRGREIKRATEDFLHAVAGQFDCELLVGPSKRIKAGGASSLVAYIGHNGLMDFSIGPIPKPENPLAARPAIVLCCKSQDYFGPIFEQLGAKPVLLTTQFMYPGGFLLRDALEGWFLGESPAQIRQRAGKAYSTNQKISQKAGLGVFASGLEE